MATTRPGHAFAIAARLSTPSAVSVAIGRRTFFRPALRPTLASTSSSLAAIFSTSAAELILGSMKPSEYLAQAARSLPQSSPPSASRGLIRTRISGPSAPAEPPPLVFSSHSLTFLRPASLSRTESSRSRTSVSAPSPRHLSRNLSWPPGTKCTERRSRAIGAAAAEKDLRAPGAGDPRTRGGRRGPGARSRRGPCARRRIMACGRALGPAG
mmetsp:Transcript_66463/g.172900  ORF Transcript_66463/g.172900 Transcript_66463/m.172900 type:complete len:212 (+) Transcript_66463:1072-1707(+)